jgi:hypothetical protein
MARPETSPPARLPRNTLRRLTLGQSFAEYDRLLAQQATVFVETPAAVAATDPSRAKCFFVGRRGTGKTAITLHLERAKKNTQILLPQLLTPLEKFFSAEEMLDVHQRPFKTLVSSFKRGLLDEVLVGWTRRGFLSNRRLPDGLTRERNYLEDYDFDLRVLAFTEDGFEALNNHQERDWLKGVNRAKEVGNEIDIMHKEASWEAVILIDRIDESWDGTDKAVVLLMALMHACVELTASHTFVRPLLFLRENVFDRVRSIDKEFARLETWVVSLDWTRELLLELIERRLNAALITKFPLRGATWRAFFEEANSDVSSQDLVLQYCQYRPRDVLTYCSFAIEAAQAKVHDQIMIEDLYAARRSFSDNRFKDLTDEYADNYPQLQLVLGRFYGLGREFTVSAIGDFIKKLLVDAEVTEHCKEWIFRYTQTDLFVRLLYDIGFFGIKHRESDPVYRAAGPQSGTLPPTTDKTLFSIHPTYTEALNLQNMIVSSLGEEVDLKRGGFIGTLPGAIDIDTYQREIGRLRDEIRTLPRGTENSTGFEDFTGELIKLCFFDSLTNVEPKVRDVGGRVVRDWIAANHSPGGFWELIRHKYGATQVIWECKNYDDLSADDFQQAAYYMNDAIGRFVVVAYRGQEKKKHYFEHIRRISADKHGMILLLSQPDIDVFLRHALNGKSNQPHLQELFDTTVRQIS